MSKHPKVTNIRPAGSEHQVVTVEGGRGDYRRRPCATCPWRKDAVGIFPAAAFKHSAHTAYDMSSSGFACHESGVETPALCAGFLLRGSAHNMAVRLRLIQGTIDPKQVADGGHELHDDYRAMAVANGVRRNDPVLRECR